MHNVVDTAKHTPHSLGAARQRIQEGTAHDPFEVLGLHTLADGTRELGVFLPAAESVRIDGVGTLLRIPESDFFVLKLKPDTVLDQHYCLTWVEKHNGAVHRQVSPYSFAAQVSDFDLHLFQEGRHQHAWKFLGAQLTRIDSIAGCQFAVWAPGVRRVSVVGDFNGWDGRRHPMRCRGSSGIWELFIPGLQAGDTYKYELLSAHGQYYTKTDPYARSMAMRPDTTSIIPQDTSWTWTDQDWIAARSVFDWQHQPVSIYECHAGSWRKHPDGSFLSWRELADQLIPWVSELGFTHIELLPISEHPLDKSWGYQVTGYFAPTARHGSPDDLRYFIDQCHAHQIGVILDWVPAHFPRDAHALARFTGEPTYEHADPKRGEHHEWGTLVFDYGRREVHNFLLTNAVYWLEEFHIDGLRVDAVASMLYLDYSRNPGEWSPNQYGGRENIEAIEFLREMNRVVHGLFPGVLTMAEESTAWPMVSRPVELGGLGFSMKWNMGWMNDSLAYIEEDPVHRKYHHDLLTFSQLYAWTENFVLPLSHDEVVHGKHSMLSKMPGDHWQKMANLRLFYAWQFAHPGKKLLFMGGELGQWLEWDEATQIDWPLLEVEGHRGIWQLLCDLNTLYREQPALHRYDHDPAGFRWIDCHDTDQSILSLLRMSDSPADSIVCVLNFTPVPRYDYRIGVPGASHYNEILNTDSQYYAGSNLGNVSRPVDATPWMGFAQSISLTVPPLSAVFLKGQQ
ncbi:MAG: 1,4-alpha-glucan branching protein GlgB [Gammaproteobacteria bacterium]